MRRNGEVNIPKVIKLACVMGDADTLKHRDLRMLKFQGFRRLLEGVRQYIYHNGGHIKM
jgi:hypothetical protein